MKSRRCWQPRSHDPHPWLDRTEQVECDGRPFQSRAVSPDASRPAGPEPQAGSAPELPPCTVHAGYVMRPDSVALHFHPDAVPALAALFPQHADALHAARLDVEMEAESQVDLAYERRTG